MRGSTRVPVTLDLAAARRLAPALALVGGSLARAGFSERSVCAFYGAELVSDVRYLTAPPGRVRRGLGAWIAMLVGGEAVERRALGAVLDGTQLAALVAVGLVEIDGDLVVPRASVIPLRGVLVAADRLDDASAEAVGSPDLSAWNLAASLPPALPSLLDVGCGAGAAALVAARAGAEVVGTDIDGRALAFAVVNAMLNDLRAVFLEGDLFAGANGRFRAVCFNAPLVRAPLATAASSSEMEATLYVRSPRGEAVATEFLGGARARMEDGGEVLCHVQLTDAVTEAAARAGLSSHLELHFADATDGTPHGLIALREGARYRARARVPLGPALPHLRRELVDRLHATAELVASGDDLLFEARLRPAPWLLLLRAAQYDGASFRPRALRFGVHRLDAEDLAILEACDGRTLAEAAGESGERRERARVLARSGLLVV